MCPYYGEMQDGLARGESKEAIVSRIAENFDLPLEEVANDFDVFINSLELGE